MTLTPDDRNLLTEEKERLETQNTNLETSNDNILNQTTDLYPLDFAFKRQLDLSHSDIYFYEEELRRLNGTSVVQSLQQDNFIIYDNNPNADSRLNVMDGRLTITENGNPIVNKLPLIPIKGYSKSRINVGTNFDIWSRDRHGFTISGLQPLPLQFTFDDYLRKLKLNLDGNDQEIDLGSKFTLPQTLTGQTLASIFQNMFRSIPVGGSITNSNASATFQIEANDILYIKVNGGTLQPAKFVVADFKSVFGNIIFATIAEIVAVLNKNWTGVTAVVTGTQITISLNNGYQKFQILDGVGSPNIKFGFSTSIIYATNSFPNCTCSFISHTALNSEDTDFNIFVFSSGSGGDSSFAEIRDADPLYESFTYLSVKGGETLFQLVHFPIVDDPNFPYNIYKNNIKLESTDFIFDLNIGLLRLIKPLVTNDNLFVQTAYISDMKNLIGFESQTTYYGKYQNNNLKVQIDGITKVIQLRDFRVCNHDPSRLGDNNDDYGTLWSGTGQQLGYIGNLRAGPLFCSGINNGKDVADCIQAKLREVNSGGFSKAVCKYFSDSQQFVIWSGTVIHDELLIPTTSSVNILPFDDTNRDVSTLLGFDVQQQELFTEVCNHLGTLYDKLGTYQNFTLVPIVDRSIWQERLSYSVLDSMNTINPLGYKITTFQNYTFPTTQIYDDGSMNLFPLYLNGKIPITSSNCNIDFLYSTSSENTIVIPNGNYSENMLANTISDLFTNISIPISCVYNSTTKKFNFVSSSGNFAFLWATGTHLVNAIGIYLGFRTVDQTMASSQISDFQTQFSNVDPTQINYPIEFFASPTLQFVIDSTVDEQSALITEFNDLLNEDSKLISLELQSLPDNEFLLNEWESLATAEYDMLTQEIAALRSQIGCYANHISENDPIMAQKLTALNSVLQNYQSLQPLLAQHAYILNIALETSYFSSPPYIFHSSSSLKWVYYAPIPIVWDAFDNQIYGSYDSTYCQKATFTPSAGQNSPHHVVFYTVDKPNHRFKVTSRRQKIASRLSFDKNLELTNITNRASAILSLLIDDSSLYLPRRNYVQSRLNSQNGTYYQIGRIQNAAARNDAVIGTNNARITEIDGMLA